MSGRALTGLRGFVDGKSGDRLRLTGADRVDRVARHEEDAPARDGGAGQNLLRCALGSAAAVRAVRQFDLADDLAAVGHWPDDEELAAVGADVDLAVGQHGRRFLECPEREGPQLLSRGTVEGLEPRAAVELIDARPVDQRRREAELNPFDRPFRSLDVAGLRPVDCRDRDRDRCLRCSRRRATR